MIEPENETFYVPEGPAQHMGIPIVLDGMKEAGIECNVTVHTEDGSAIGKLYALTRPVSNQTVYYNQ